MRGIFPRLLLLAGAMAILAVQAQAQDQTDVFHWVDFHSQKDQPYVIWVERSLQTDTWSAIREIGVEYDAALVVTTDRSGPDASPAADTFTIWNVNLTTHVRTVLLKGVNLRWLGWVRMRESAPRELAVLYDDCHDCAATTYFTALAYDLREHIFLPRWLRGGQAAPVWTVTAPEGVKLTQMYAVLSDPTGLDLLATWSHYDYGKEKDPDDYVYRYDVDPASGLERAMLLSGKAADAMKQRLCSVDGEAKNRARGQDSALCLAMDSARPERRPVTTPPADNQGRSVPPGTRKSTKQE
jgi:hypothetical protein